MTRTVSLLLLATLLAAGCSSGLDLKRPETQLAVGVRAARGDLWREAMFRFQRAAEMDPDNAQVFNNLAVAYEGIGEFDKAKDAYLKALQFDRSNQYIQKNYSRYVEFVSRNKKRGLPSEAEQSAAPEGSPSAAPSTTTASPSAPAPAPPAETPPPPPPVEPPQDEAPPTGASDAPGGLR